MTKRGLAKCAGIVALSLCIVVFLSQLFTPTWKQEINDSVEGFYSQPRNTVQVLCLGTSTMQRVSMDTLYTDYGICAYDLGMPSAPLLTQYYWLKESVRVHGGSLSTVVLDPAALFVDEKVDGRLTKAEQALAKMRMSPVKIEALLECNRRYDDFDLLEFLVPVLRYHSRWSEMEPDDYSSLVEPSREARERGQYVVYTLAARTQKQEEILVPDKDITPQIDHSAAELEAMYLPQNREMLERIVSFCRDHGLQVLFAKLPRTIWGDLYHDAVQVFADEHGIEFIDYSTVETYEQTGIYYPLDYSDYSHANVRGGEKLALHLGAVLKDKFDIEDVRDNPKYAFMADDAAEHAMRVEDGDLALAATLPDLAVLLDRERYTVFVGTCGDVSGLDADSVKALRAAGCESIGEVTAGNGYAAVLHGGKLVKESSKGAGRASVSGSYDGTHVNVRKQSSAPDAEVPYSFRIDCGAEESALDINALGEKSTTYTSPGLFVRVYDDLSGRQICDSRFDASGQFVSVLVPEGYDERLREALG